MKFISIVSFISMLGRFCFGRENTTDIFLPDSRMDLLKLDSNNLTDPGEKNTIIPENLNETCSLISDTDKTYAFFCAFNKTNSGLWDFSEIRRWTSSSDYDFKFDIFCNHFASIGLQWPMKAINIVHLKVEGCSITNFFTDYGNPIIETIPDKLRVLDLRNSVILFGIMDLMSLIKTFKNMSEEYNCGNDKSLQTLMYRNITYRFEEELSKHTGNELIENGGVMIANTRSLDHRCTFKQLEILDQSTSNYKSRYFLTLQTEFSTFPELKYYNLSNTGQTEIAKEFQNWWRFYPKLKTLDLSHNFISTIDIDQTTNGWQEYELDIDLTYNNITEIKREDLELLSSISNMFVDIRNNPLHCDCSDDFVEVLDFINDDARWESMNLQRYDYIKEMVCNLPEALKGRQLGGLERSDLDCPKYVASLAVAPIVILSVTIVILVVVIILLTKFRKEIFILTYTRFHIVLPCQPADVFENKRYDAFVSYSNQDEEWVSKTFKDLESCSPENYHQFRFCLHHRDFIPGKTIFDNVIDSVESSRHTVVILSRHFLQSHYCMYEFHEAFQQSIIERKRHMVVVLMENIPEQELPTDLRRCLKTFTYIRKDDSIFTDRLIYAMSHKPKKLTKSSKKAIAEVHENPGFSQEIDVSSSTLTSRPRHDDSVLTLSQIVPDLVIGHNETKTNGYTIA